MSHVNIYYIMDYTVFKKIIKSGMIYFMKDSHYIPS